MMRNVFHIPKCFKFIDNSDFMKAMRRGFMMSFPVALVGCFACVLENIPLEAYSEFIASFGGGVLKNLFSQINFCCVGCISLWMTCFISYSYGVNANRQSAPFYAFVSVSGYMILAYDAGTDRTLSGMFSSQWMLMALLATLLACRLFRRLLHYFQKKRIHIYSSGADTSFTMVIRHVCPIVLTVLVFGVLRAVLFLLCGRMDVYGFGNRISELILHMIPSDFLAGLIFVLSIHLLWFLGIHGSDMLESVAQAMEQRMGTGVICSKSFIDVFVLMGGCGVSLCILAAILLTAKSQQNRKLARLSILPGLFNINEMVVYGLPVFYNATLLIPFVLAPVSAYLLSYLATLFGFVPVVSTSVTWQMPIFFSGYMATGSFAGVLLQAVNLFVGVMIYIPFIRRLEVKQRLHFHENIRNVTDAVKSAEKSGGRPHLLQRADEVGITARGIANDLCYTIENIPEDLELYYQPQVNHDGSLDGFEALLRWAHPAAGFLYPPLLIDLAHEASKTDALGLLLIEKACAALEQLSLQVGKPIKLSVNITADQLTDPDFASNVRTILERYDFHGCGLVFELTEQISLTTDPVMNSQLDALTAMGILLSLDDFGMGHSSLIYLQQHQFSYIKLDGSIVGSLLTNPASTQIVSSMAEFSQKTNSTLIAEYVESKEQISALHDLGCDCYQGYYYAKALPYEETLAYLSKHNTSNKEC